MDELDASDELFEEFNRLMNVDAFHSVAAADTAVTQVRDVTRFMRLAAPVDLMATGTLLASGIPSVVAAGKATAALGSAMSGAYFLDAARRVRRLGKLAQHHAELGEYEVAFYVSSARVSLLRILPTSKTRLAVENLRRMIWAAQLATTDQNNPAVNATIQALGKLSARQLARVQQEAVRLLPVLDDIEILQDRACAREMFIAAFEDHPFGGYGEFALELAVDYAELAQEIWVEQSEGEHEELAEADFDYSILEEIDPEDLELDDDDIEYVLSKATFHVARGLGRIRSETNRDVADAWARKLLKDDRIPTVLVLEAFGISLELAGDDRLPEFRKRLAEPDPEKRSALGFLALEPDAIGRDGLDR